MFCASASAPPGTPIGWSVAVALFLGSIFAAIPAIAIR